MSRRLTLVAAVLAALVPAAVAAPARAEPPLASIDARAFVVENAATGEVLADRNADEEMPIASITKLMTVLVVLDHAHLSDVVAVDPRAARVGELIEAALIQSANNAADALALHVAPSFAAFAKLMNAKARALGLAHSHFVRPDGLDARGEYSTARDATRLGWLAMRIPFVRRAVAKESATIGDGIELHTWDDLLPSFPGMIGVKTGHTAAAGWSQVGAARGRGVTIYATILGSPDRATRNAGLAALLRYGLSRFTVVPAVRAGRVYATVRLPYGHAPLPLVASRGYLRVVHVRRPLVERVVARAVAALPVRQGQVLGTVTVSDGGRVVARRDLVAARSVARPGTVDRLRFYAGRTARHLWSWVT